MNESRMLEKLLEERSELGFRLDKHISWLAGNKESAIRIKQYDLMLKQQELMSECLEVLNTRIKLIGESNGVQYI